jgi:hypothetical protein
VIKHSNNLQHRVVSPQGVPRARGVLYEDTLTTAYRPCRGRDVLNRTLRRSSRGLVFATRQYRNCSNQAEAMRHDELSCALKCPCRSEQRGRGEPGMLPSWDHHRPARRPALIAVVRHCGTRDRADRAVSASVAAAITCGT